MIGVMGVMDGAETVASKGRAALEFERLEGELEASIIFAAAGIQEYQRANAESGAACFSDARECYANFLGGLSSTAISEDERRQFGEKRHHLGELLDWLTTTADRFQNEAA